MTNPLDRLVETLKDRYALQRELGRGGMATVYLAEDLKHHRPVALKVLRPELAAVLGSERFLREIELSARLTHPHILPLHDSGNAGGFLYYVMPYVEGESLRDRLTREKQLPVDDALQISREVADALSYAHSRGVIHRDIKPENILLESGHAVVADFGIARAIDQAGGEKLTATGIALGTPAYMSPEQAAGSRDLDGRSDLYSLGCVLYEMLAGHPPFVGASVESLVQQHLTAAVPPITGIRPAVPAHVAATLERALSKTPADRFNPVALFAEALGPRGSAAVTPSPAVGQPRRRSRLVLTALIVGGVAVGIVATEGIRRLATHGSGGGSHVPRLVVLPFENLGNPEDQYFADGLVEEITSRLSALRDLAVIGRTSAEQYKETTRSIRQIGEELRVDYVLEGSVRWQHSTGGSDRVRITPQLINVADETHVWSDRYDAVLADIFEVQAAIAGQVAGAIGVTLREGESARAGPPTANLHAYDLYLRGDDYMRRRLVAEDLQTAIALYEEAVGVDSGFAEAYAALARARVWAYWHYGDTASLAPARAALARAQELAPDRTETQIAAAQLLYYGRRDFRGALEILQPVLQEEPNNAEVNGTVYALHRRLGEWNEAVRYGSRMIDLDPKGQAWLADFALTRNLMRDYASAERLYQTAISLAPGVAYPYSWLAVLYVEWGRPMAEVAQVVAQMMDRARPAPVRTELARLFPRQTLSWVARVEHRGWETMLVLWEAARQMHDTVLARGFLDSAVALGPRPFLYEGTQAAYLSTYARLLAARGDTGGALARAREATALLTPEADAFSGADIAQAVVEVYILVGRFDEAIELLDRLLSIPSHVSVPLLEADPLYDPLRALPEFQALLRKHPR